ncbi:hypothetical protein [Nonomuraea roseola]|uniref:FXSXX-COOH protein n=1 Tax=Nonomuraea roseola TaxID=46179 RepID=A0ABV5PPZ1_9ACTN
MSVGDLAEVDADLSLLALVPAVRDDFRQALNGGSRRRQVTRSSCWSPQ